MRKPTRDSGDGECVRLLEVPLRYTLSADVLRWLNAAQLKACSKQFSRKEPKIPPRCKDDQSRYSLAEANNQYFSKDPCLLEKRGRFGGELLTGDIPPVKIMKCLRYYPFDTRNLLCGW